MQDAALRQRGFAQQRQGIGARLAGVHDHRFTGDPGSLQVQTESLLLQLRGFWLVVVIQAGFADGNYPGVVQLGQQPVQGWRDARFEIQGVDTYRTVDIGITLGQAFDRRGVVGANADTEKMANATRSRSAQRRIERAVVRGKIEAIEVAVGIDKH
ncbi:hypothetical protein D9M68_829370 [compost metagenome]